MKKNGNDKRKVSYREPKRLVFQVGTVSPELTKNKQLFEAERSYQLPLRVAFLALLACCNREGKFNWEPESLKSQILPFDTVDISKVLEALLDSGFIKKVEENGKLYGCIPLEDDTAN